MVSVWNTHKKTPKAMLKIDNKPLLEHIIEKLKREE